MTALGRDDMFALDSVSSSDHSDHYHSDNGHDYLPSAHSAGYYGVSPPSTTSSKSSSSPSSPSIFLNEEERAARRRLPGRMFSEIECERGTGLAISTYFGVIAVGASSWACIRLYKLSTYEWLADICEDQDQDHLYLKFSSGHFTLAFSDVMPDGSPPVLMVADLCLHAVHIVDVARLLHGVWRSPDDLFLGFLGHATGPVSVQGPTPDPQGVATRGMMAAVSSWHKHDSGRHAIYLFRRRSTKKRAFWAVDRVICHGRGPLDGYLSCPKGLRFTADGLSVVVADFGNNRVSQFAVSDGCFEQHLFHVMNPIDVEFVHGCGCPKDADDVLDWRWAAHGWSCGYPSTYPRKRLQPWDGSEVATLSRWLVLRKKRHYSSVISTNGFKWVSEVPKCGNDDISSLAFVPGGGFAVHTGDFVRILFTNDAMAAARMSDTRFVWFCCVARGIRSRRRSRPV